MTKKKIKGNHSFANKKEAKTAVLFLLPSMIGVFIFILFPFADVIRRSFMKAMGGEFVGIDNYKEVFSNKAFHQAMANTGHFSLFVFPCY